MGSITAVSPEGSGRICTAMLDAPRCRGGGGASTKGTTCACVSSSTATGSPRTSTFTADGRTCIRPTPTIVIGTALKRRSPTVGTRASDARATTIHGHGRTQ